MLLAFPFIEIEGEQIACSTGVFWVGETLFVFVFVSAIFDFMTVEDWGE